MPGMSESRVSKGHLAPPPSASGRTTVGKASLERRGEFGQQEQGSWTILCGQGRPCQVGESGWRGHWLIMEETRIQHCGATQMIFQSRSGAQSQFLKRPRTS